MLEAMSSSLWKLDIPKSGLILHLDALNPRSYNGTNQWRDLSPYQNHVDFYGQVLRDNQYLYSPLGANGYGRTTNILQGINGVSTITVINISYSPIPETGFAGMLYEHTANWNAINNYNGVEYGGFGFLHHSQGTELKPNTVHCQIKGTRNVNGEPTVSGYAGSNFYTPNGETPQVYCTIHDVSQTEHELITTAYVNAVEAPEDTVSPIVVGGQTVNINNTFVDDYLYLLSRGGTSIFGENRIATLLIYNRRLSVVEIANITSLLKRQFRLS